MNFFFLFSHFRFSFRRKKVDLLSFDNVLTQKTKFDYTTEFLNHFFYISNLTKKRMNKRIRLILTNATVISNDYDPLDSRKKLMLAKQRFFKCPEFQLSRIK